MRKDSHINNMDTLKKQDGERSSNHIKFSSMDKADAWTIELYSYLTKERLQD